MSVVLEALGWIGAALVLGAYYLLSFKRISSDSYTYHGLNIVGSILLGGYAIWKNAGASVLVNGVWLCIGIGAVWTLWRAGRKLRQG